MAHLPAAPGLVGATRRFLDHASPAGDGLFVAYLRSGAAGCLRAAGILPGYARGQESALADLTGGRWRFWPSGQAGFAAFAFFWWPGDKLHSWLPLLAALVATAGAGGPCGNQ